MAARWEALRAEGRAALIPYITAGWPDLESTRAVLRGAEAAGADLIELGVPFSDPVADGPVIQASSFAALRAGVTLQKVLDVLSEVRPGIPVVLFSYINPILAYGASRLAEAARDAGAAGLLVTDLPVGADPAVEYALGSAGLPLVRLVAPTTDGPRLKAIAAASRGFVYLVARLGVTGAGRAVTPELAARITAAREACRLPVAVGFGISRAEEAAAVSRVADGVVVGSAVVKRMGESGAPGGLAVIAGMREAMDRAGRPQ